MKKITDIETAKAVIANEAVDCFLGKEQKASKQPKELVSCTGGEFWGRRGETWPQTHNEQPLIPWLQIACTEMKELYGPFYQKQLVAFFIRDGFTDVEASSAHEKSDFVVREYGLSDKLIPLPRPMGLERHVFRQVIWRKTLDYPSIRKFGKLFDDDVYSALCKEGALELENSYGLKIGGWPTPVQREQQYPGSCHLQIDMTENIMYGDSGIGYLSKMGDSWYVMFECC